jgi:hypothetical protein
MLIVTQPFESAASHGRPAEESLMTCPSGVPDRTVSSDHSSCSARTRNSSGTERESPNTTDP